MAKTRNLQELSAEELDEQHQKAMAQKEEARQRCADIQSERDRRALKERVGNLSDDEKRALVQHIQAEGIESKEAVGEPGR